MATHCYDLFERYKTFREFLTFSSIVNAVAYLPPQSLHLATVYDQDVVNKFMRAIVDKKIVTPVIVSSETRVVLSGTNEYQAYLQLNKMIPVLMVGAKDRTEYKHILANYDKWRQRGGADAMTIDDWIKGIDYD